MRDAYRCIVWYMCGVHVVSWGTCIVRLLYIPVYNVHVVLYMLYMCCTWLYGIVVRYRCTRTASLFLCTRTVRFRLTQCNKLVWYEYGTVSSQHSAATRTVLYRTVLYCTRPSSAQLRASPSVPTVGTVALRYRYLYSYGTMSRMSSWRAPKHSRVVSHWVSVAAGHISLSLSHHLSEIVLERAVS